VFVYLLASAVR